MNNADYDFLSELLLVKSGLALTQDKTYLIETRLGAVVKDNDLPSLEALITILRSHTNKNLERDVIEAMATHETFFFRDSKPFDAFKQIILPELIQNRQRQRALRIWCAACSTGQEPYSLAMILDEASAQLQGWSIEIVGTDLCKSTIDRAKEGIYSQFEAQRGLPIKHLVKYFKQIGERWYIDQKLKEKVTFSVFNQLEDPRHLGKFDLIFCRNVLIYFDPINKKKSLSYIAAQLNDDGYLCLGGAETVIGISNDLHPSSAARGMYQKIDANAKLQRAL